MPVYQSIYNLISEYIYGGVMDDFSTLICTLFATSFSFCALAFPIIVVYWASKFIMSFTRGMF